MSELKDKHWTIVSLYVAVGILLAVSAIAAFFLMLHLPLALGNVLGWDETLSMILQFTWFFAIIIGIATLHIKLD